MHGWPSCGYSLLYWFGRAFIGFECTEIMVDPSCACIALCKYVHLLGMNEAKR